jgi:hypothetical protein
LAVILLQHKEISIPQLNQLQIKVFIKTTTLTTDAIALYMPETLQFSYTQNYDTAEFGSGVAGQLAAAGVSAASGYKEDGVFEALGALGKSGALGIGSAVSGLLGKDGSSVAFQALAGVAKIQCLN